MQFSSYIPSFQPVIFNGIQFSSEFSTFIEQIVENFENSFSTLDSYFSNIEFSREFR